MTEAQFQEVVSALQTLRADNAGLTQQLIDLQKSVAGSKDGGRQGDAVEKLLKRTETFDGNNFQDWKFRVETNMRAVLLDGAAILKQSEHATGDIAEKDLINFNLDVNVDKILFYFLAAACKGEAFDIVRNVPGGLGAEAWRRLCRRFGAKTRGKKVVLLRRCVNPPKVKQLGEAPGLIEKWEGDVQRLSADFKESLSDGVKCGVLLEMMPPAVTEFLTQRMEEEDTYQDTKEAIIRYVQVKADLGGPVPMDCSSLEIQDTTSGQSRDVPGHDVHGHLDGRDENQSNDSEDPGLNAVMKGKGKGKPFPGQCHYCGRWGHRLVECPTKDHDMNKGKGKGQWTQWDVKGQGKSDSFNTKGFGKGKTGKSNPTAYTKGQHHQWWSGPSSWKGGKGTCVLG